MTKNHVDQDTRNAFALLSRGGLHGNIHAKGMLIQIDFATGHVRNWDQLVSRLKSFEDEGVPVIQYSLGLLYEKGWGVKRDLKQSLKFFILAEYLGSGNASKRQQKVEIQLRPPEIAEAKKQAHDWLLSASANSETYIGRASKWCQEFRKDSFTELPSLRY